MEHKSSPSTKDMAHVINIAQGRQEVIMDNGAQLHMDDDISLTLRDMASVIDGLQGRAEVKMTSGHMLAEAADEIDRLRAEVSRLNLPKPGQEI